ncbi:MAG: amidohydrolase family protein [Gammaproteobacteria bacterium]|nr:amidohydrolase family protein [Gammaproteobacteria bacterium]
MRSLRVVVSILLYAGALQAIAQGTGKPIIDVHLHAFAHDSQGPYPSYVCAPFKRFPVWDPASGPYVATFTDLVDNPDCGNLIRSQPDDESLMRRTIELMQANNVIGIAGGSRDYVTRWQAAAPDRMIPALHFRITEQSPSPESIQLMFAGGEIAVLSEVTIQYQGIEPDDPRFRPWLAKLEEIDMPMGIHIGTGPPGAPYLGNPDYRGRFHSPLSLEEPLMKHPGLRVYVMHAGWPMLDDTLALLWAHPQVYVGIGVINWALPRREFHRYLKALVEAGFGNRIMFGSDQMVWPETIEVAIGNIEAAEFLSEDEKRDIFYNNAARFFRFTERQIEAHHAL